MTRARARVTNHLRCSRLVLDAASPACSTFGGEMHSEQRLGDLIIPSRLPSAGDTARRTTTRSSKRISARRNHNHHIRRSTHDTSIDRTDRRHSHSSHRRSRSGVGDEDRAPGPARERDLRSRRARRRSLVAQRHTSRGHTHPRRHLRRPVLLARRVCFLGRTRSRKAIAIELFDERYHKLVVEVENPDQDIARIEDAIATATTPSAVA